LGTLIIKNSYNLQSAFVGISIARKERGVMNEERKRGKNEKMKEERESGKRESVMGH
jgi:hypothetical protein